MPLTFAHTVWEGQDDKVIKECLTFNFEITFLADCCHARPTKLLWPDYEYDI